MFYGPPAEALLPKVSWLITHCYAGGPERTAAYLEKVGRENFRCLTGEAGELLASCALFEGGQWFGGKVLPSTGIAAVGVPLQLRGQQGAGRLMREVLRELFGRKIALSSLYPSVQALYRGVGYETAGGAHTWKINPFLIGIKDRSLPVFPIDPQDHSLTQGLYEKLAAQGSGYIQRSPLFWWRTLRCSSEETLYAWLVGPKEAPEGYLLYSQTTGESGIEVLVRDRVALTQAAHLRIWTLLADLNSVVEKAELRAPANDPGLAMLPEEFATIEHYSRWMLRIVNVVQAFELRGYAADGVLELEVQDEVLPENGGRWRLVVEAGQARMERGGEGTLRATIRGLAPLFTGLFTPYQLCRMGWVEADAASCEVAARLFAGPEPYMADKF